MKESRLYLNFFRSNLLILIIPAIIFGLIVFFYQLSKPVEFEYGELFEFEYNQTNLNNKIAEVDEAVTVLRSTQLQRKLGVTNDTNVNIFKPGPISIKLEVSSRNQATASRNMGKLTNYLNSEYVVKQVGIEDLTQVHEPLLLPVLIAVGFGLALGLIVSLVKEYFKNF